MKINSFKAKGVHDYLDFEINFFSELTFLIGINGSGKTSALKLILGLLSPSYNYLSQIDYEYCEIVCSSDHNERDIIIRAEQQKNDHTFTLSLNYQNEIFAIASEPIKRLLKIDETFHDPEELYNLEQRHKEYFDLLEITKRIRALDTPKFLGLDRRIYEGRNIDLRYRNKRWNTLGKFRKKQNEGYGEAPSIDYSLEDVQALVFDYIRKIAQQQSQISDDFKQKIFTQSFSFIENQNSYGDRPRQETIEIRKREVLKAIDNLGIKYLDWYVNTFFDKILEIAKQLEQEELYTSDNSISQQYINLLLKWNNNSPQLKRIDDIISYSQEYQQKIAELRAPLKKLESITSQFLKEGGKVLHVAADGEIKVKLKNGKSANVYELSSGEKQVIIMIAHLIFEEDQKPSGVFIIDEPELSLHIAWQEIFVTSILEASPKTQFILATHSPSIIATIEREMYCQDLNKLNF